MFAELIAPLPPPGRRTEVDNLPSASRHWYDVTVSDGANGTFSRRFAGHVENSRPSYSAPAAVQPVSAS
ncbi:phospholipase domain-containing protein [Burkholderia pyrrocinia]|uniref:phospholipase domain-containing protein n=1 Tax=Burkholderia pyrrocinia TaxID=60550 RepID=UPI0037DC89FF